MVVVTHEEDIAEFTKRILKFRDGRLCSDKRRGEDGNWEETLPEALEKEEKAHV